MRTAGGWPNGQAGWAWWRLPHAGLGGGVSTRDLHSHLDVGVGAGFGARPCVGRGAVGGAWTRFGRGGCRVWSLGRRCGGRGPRGMARTSLWGGWGCGEVSPLPAAWAVTVHFNPVKPYGVWPRAPWRPALPGAPWRPALPGAPWRPEPPLWRPLAPMEPARKQPANPSTNFLPSIRPHGAPWRPLTPRAYGAPWRPLAPRPSSTAYTAHYGCTV